MHTLVTPIKIVDARIEAQRRREAQTKRSDYATTNAEVRPLIAGCINDASLKKIVHDSETKK